MLSAIYVEKKNGITAKKIYNELKQYHKKNYFIKIVPLNKNLGTENVLNTNFCEISVCSLKDKKKLLILSAIDNLVKGAAGQAVQNMNVIFGYRENLGLL
jgi:N-acetyl-gamma-glutamyl-phosphate reductase